MFPDTAEGAIIQSMRSIRRVVRLGALFPAIFLLAMSGTGSAETGPGPSSSPAFALSPDAGFPVWLTNNPEDYLPLIADQTSGLDFIAVDSTADCPRRVWLLEADDADRGGIRVITVEDCPDGVGSHLRFPNIDLTLPPPAISGLPIESGHGYDWESVALHPWSSSIFLAQEGSKSEIGIYLGKTTPSDILPSEGAWGRAGEVKSIPGHIVNLRRLELPGWDRVFGPLVGDNRGIEGIACWDDRLFVGLESPYEFTERLGGVKSTILAVWKINPDDPSDMKNCELLATHDTSDWSDSIGYTVETICGLDALDRNHLVGVDRDNTRLFSVELDDSGSSVRGRFSFLAVPGPAPLESDGCPPLDHLPALLKPSLESVASVPIYDEGPNCPDEINGYELYLAVDPWGPGWALVERGWDCPKYRDRLNSLLPALYRYIDGARLP